MEKSIVYIIIIAVWIISSIIKAKNKNAKKAAQSTTPKPQNNTEPGGMDDFKKILEEMIVGKQQEMPTPQKAEVKQDTSDYSLEQIDSPEQSKYAAYEGKAEYSFNKYTTLEDTYEFEKEKNEKISQNDYYNTSTTVENEHKHEEVAIQFFDEEFDLRKAVIYAEILKRPHF